MAEGVGFEPLYTLVRICSSAAAINSYLQLYLHSQTDARVARLRRGPQPPATARPCARITPGCAVVAVGENGRYAGLVPLNWAHALDLDNASASTRLSLLL